MSVVRFLFGQRDLRSAGGVGFVVTTRMAALLVLSSASCTSTKDGPEDSGDSEVVVSSDDSDDSETPTPVLDTETTVDSDQTAETDNPADSPDPSDTEVSGDSEGPEDSDVDTDASCLPFDIRDASDFQRFTRAIQGATGLFDSSGGWFGLVEVDDTCPGSMATTVQGAEEAFAYTGGCQTALGVSYDGSVVYADYPGFQPFPRLAWSLDASDWAVDGMTGAYGADIAFDGTAQQEWQNGDQFVFTLDGTVTTSRTEVDGPVFPDGYTGTYTFTWTREANGDLDHVWTWEIDHPCTTSFVVESHVVANAFYRQNGHYNVGFRRVTIDGHIAEIDLSQPVAPGCWTHVYDGQPGSVICGF